MVTLFDGDEFRAVIGLEAPEMSLLQRGAISPGFVNGRGIE